MTHHEPDPVGEVSIESIPDVTLGLARLVHLLEDLLRERRARTSYFRRDLFADPAWDIFLVLFLAETQQRRLSVSEVCNRVAVPATTALRWITRLTEDGLLVRRRDPTDKRRVFLELSSNTSAAMCSYCWSTSATLRLAA